jgi:hypothetical protein
VSPQGVKKKKKMTVATCVIRVNVCARESV